MNYRAALDWLYSTQLTGIKLGLDTVRRLLTAIDFRTDAKILHVAGTNGKGSTCALLDAVCRAQGLHTGLFTSPHLVSFRERIRLDGENISEDAIAAGLTHLRNLTLDWTPPPTFFEYTTVLALDWLRCQPVEVIVLETGLGGRLDATNALTPAVSVITPIDFDHMAWLGDTLAAIAGEKAGIIKPGVPVVSAPQEPEAAEVIARTALARGSALRVVTEPIPDAWPLALAGSHQRANAALAFAALDAAGIDVTDDARRAGLARVRWPGRFERFDQGRLVLDGAHNPAAARRLARTWHEEFGDHHPATVIVGMMGDKDIPAVCRALAPLAARIVATPVRNPRAVPPEQIRDAFALVAPEVPVHVAVSLPDALESARSHPDQVILVTGSFFLVGEALALLTGQETPEVSWQ